MPTDKSTTGKCFIDWGVPRETEGHEDNSAIFSLRSLIEQAEATPPSEGSARGDDSGLIDLTALGAIHRNQLPRTALPLFTLPTPEAAPELVVEPVPEFRSRRAAWLRGAALFVAAAAVVAIGASGLSETRVEAAETGLGELAVAPIPAVELEAPNALPVKAVETKKEEAKAEPKPVSVKTAKALNAQAKPEVRRTPVVKKAPSPEPAKAPTPPPEKSEPKPAPVDPCHGDLMCAMKRATGG